MPIRVTRYQPTPNPNAVKCHLDRAISAGPRSFRSRAEGMGDATAGALFAVAGVSGLLLNGEWMTVNKDPDAEWARVKSGVERALEGLGGD
jgi:hypothetical protein